MSTPRVVIVGGGFAGFHAARTLHKRVADRAEVVLVERAGARVPDLTRPGELTAMTAQHAQRQGVVAGRNVAASLGYGERTAYKHHDLGFVVDLAPELPTSPVPRAAEQPPSESPSATSDTSPESPSAGR